MEGKTFILSVFVMSLFMAKKNVQAFPFSSMSFAYLSQGNDHAIEYCNVGCVSSVCGALTSLHNSDASEIVKGTVEKCANACSTICSKGSMNAVETA
ncbi:hypothetical protein CARUB_v10021518mg [Capsella rubella]|uniref:Thionin-like protein n=1 Tax=Capsella rubella TaxID=81985 RepID=R0GE31_9BRAS|nr:hypothetical protein CARUB_v10021518mg [Capsella rubella]